MLIKIKTILFMLLFCSADLFAQNCNEFFGQSEFSTMVSPAFYIEGRSEYYPCVQLRVYVSKKDSGVLHIIGSAGNCEQRVNNEFGAEFGTGAPIKEDRKSNDIPFDITQLHFTFDDGRTFMVYNESSRITPNSVYIYQSQQTLLFQYFKLNKLTDIKIVFSTANAEYKIPILNSTDRKSNQDFFINLFRCLEW